jgi:hypothetical protein
MTNGAPRSDERLTHSSTEEGEEEGGVAGDLRRDLEFCLQSAFVRRIIIGNAAQAAWKGGPTK